MLWRGFKVDIFTGLGFTLLAIWAMRRFMQPWLNASPTWSNKKLALIWPLILVLMAFGIRSSIGHRPANPALFAITQDSMVNSLVLNSGYSVFYAIYGLQHESKSSDIYGKMPKADIFKLTGAQDTDIPTLKFLKWVCQYLVRQ